MRLADVLNTGVPVSIGNGDVIVYGISLTQLSELIGAHAAVFETIDVTDVPSAARLIADSSPAVISDLLSRALRDTVTEDDVKALPAGAAINLIIATIEQTFPGGFGPFVERISTLVNEFNAAVSDRKG